MALEVHYSRDKNIFIGEDKILQHYVTTGIPVEVTDDAAAGDTSLHVHNLSEALSNGGKLRLGNMIVTLTAAADVGDTTITVSALAGGILKGSLLRQVQDVTGWTFTFVISAHPQATTAILTITPAITSAANGVITTTIADTDTDALVPGEYFYKLWRTTANFETVLQFGKIYLQG